MADEESILSLPFKFFFANTSVGMVLTDLRGKILAANPAFATLVGHRLPEIDGQDFLSFIPAARIKDVRGVLDALVSNTRPRYIGEMPLSHASGRTLTTLLGAALAQDDSGRPLGMTLTLLEFPADHDKNRAPASAAAQSVNQTNALPVWYDSVTGLKNHLLFQEQVRHAITKAEREGKKLGVLVLDLDRFKELNDSLGHLVGNQLLKDTGTRIVSFVRKSDTVARIGGNQFAILLEGLDRAELISSVAQKLTSVFAAPFSWQGEDVYVSASIGISVFPVDGIDSGSLMKNAESAMHQVKKEGGNAFQFYTRELNAKAMARIKMDSELHRALKKTEFVLHYQPVVDISGDQVTCLEALLRWNHPEKGLMPPLSFIPLLEETGFITQVGDWILHTACRQIKALRNNGFSQLRMAVNVSARQFSQKDFALHVGGILQGAGLDPRALELEITESVLIQNSEKSWKILESIAAQGVRIALDDFGTGYSSLSYLKRFPIHTLKIDQNFVQGVPKKRDDVAITNAILALADSLGLKVIAEGVETKEQHAFLRERNCHELQGFLFSRPMPAEELGHWLRNRAH
jgi:diguanylate cyclase (GGDEF)-like protein/PAS domain S-box-containing protein